MQFRHKVLLLFKLLLLEKRIVFYQSPVQPLCATILTLLSLYPDMIEHGLQQAACVRYYGDSNTDLVNLYLFEINSSLINNPSFLQTIQADVSDSDFRRGRNLDE